MAISSLLNIAGDAITVNRIAIDITGANIANVNTPGYTRQRVDFNAISNVDVASGRTDFGVRVDSIERLYNSYLETQLVDQAQKTGFDEARQQMMSRVEGVFNESGSSGLSDSLNQFWNSWEALSSNPTSQAARYSVVSTASNLASLFRENSNVLSGVQQDIEDSMGVAVQDINAAAGAIARLNEQILATGSQDGSANNLLDKRMELLKGLATNINISYYESSDGTVNVFLANGKLLVGGSSADQLSVANGNVTFKSAPLQVLNNVITGGKLGAMIEMDGTTVAGYSRSLDQLANGIIAAVNTQHQAGWDAGGSHLGDAAFVPDFFAVLPGAKNMRVSAAIAADPQKVAASDNAGNNGANATLIGALKDNLTMDGGVSTFTDFYAALVGKVGSDVQAIDSSVERNTAVTNQLSAQRDGTSGVSMDEEIINLMKYQFGYNAAGKLAKAASDMLDVLMSLGK